jgi:hypothetical protein
MADRKKRPARGAGSEAAEEGLDIVTEGKIGKPPKRRIPKDITNRGNPNKRKPPKKPSPTPPGLPKYIAGRPASDLKRAAEAFGRGFLTGLGTGPRTKGGRRKPPAK